MDNLTWRLRTCSRGDKDVVMSSKLLARFVGLASALLKAFLTRFSTSTSFSPTIRIEEKNQLTSFLYGQLVMLKLVDESLFKIRVTT